MRPDVDTAAPPTYRHLSENLKGKQAAAEKQAEVDRLNIILAQRLKTTPSISGLPPAQGPGSTRPEQNILSWPERMERACMTGDMPLLNQTLFHVGCAEPYIDKSLCSDALIIRSSKTESSNN